MGKALIFCGIKHCGKSTLGKLLARSLDVPFLDTDELLEERWHSTVRELFTSVGEEEFRRRESAIIRELKADTLQVISLGGGALLREENIPLLQSCGTIIWCDTDDRTAFGRITVGGLPPFLAQAADPFEEFKKRNRSRREIFAAAASVRFEPSGALSPEENTAKLRQILTEKGLIGK